MWIDAHCHLQWDEIDAGAIEEARAADVEHIVCVGTDLETSQQAVDIARGSDGYVSAVVGLHPHDAKNGVEAVAAFAESIADDKAARLVGIGETGLDYFYDHSPRNIQREVFAYQIDLAKRLDVALIIHTRDAWNDTYEILRSEGPPPRTAVHCFTGGVKEASIALDLGLYLSFSGVVTFKKSVEVQEAARFCPLDRLTIETDSPFLSPVPFRGRPNGPAKTAVIGSYISELRDTNPNDFASSVKANTERLFNL